MTAAAHHEEGGTVVGPLTPALLDAAGDLHSRALPDGFLSQLGPRFLRRYLATFSHVPGGIALASSTSDGRFSGFLVGTTVAGHNRLALQLSWRTLLPAAAAGLAVRPVVLLHFLRTRLGRYARTAWKARRRGSAPHEGVGARGPAARTAVLLHVAVSPDLRGQGTGAMLVEEFVRRAREAGCARARLVSFGDTAEFYRRLGWSRLASQIDDGGRDVTTWGRAL